VRGRNVSGFTMRWSLKLARIAGIDVRIHVTFFLLLAWVGHAAYSAGGTDEAIYNLTLILALFGCVLLHEFGHALAARRFDILTPDITLLPIGGVARLQRMPDNPWQELIVALAGPAVNVVILGLLAPFTDLGVAWHFAVRVQVPAVGFLLPLAVINLGMVLFNLLPAFPMDGGRVLRALLALRLRYGRATQIAAWIGQGFCFLFATYGVIDSRPMLVLLAFFIYVAGSQEAAAARLKDVATGLRVEDAMLTEFSALPEHAVLDDAVALLLRSSQHEIPVVDAAGGLRGLLTRDDLIAALKKHGAGAPVADVMRRDLPRVHPLDPFDTAFQQMQECGCPALPVVDSTGRLTGLITPENVGELMVVHSLRLRGRPPAWRTRPPTLPSS
jgi:Zn-dependent protease/CBS domain-containing protein